MAVTAPEVLEKQPSEKRAYSMDFSNLMGSSETIVSIDTVTSEKRGGGNSDLMIMDTSISGQTVRMWIYDGTACTAYRVQVKITTSTGAILEGDGIIEVEDK